MHKKKWLCMAFITGLLLTGCGGAPSEEGSAGASRPASTQTEENGSGSGENSAADAGSDQMTLRVGTNLALGTATPYVSRELGYFDDSSISMELLEFSDGSALMEAFAADEMDIAFVGVAPVATWYSKGVPLKIVAAAMC